MRAESFLLLLCFFGRHPAWVYAGTFGALARAGVEPIQTHDEEELAEQAGRLHVGIYAFTSRPLSAARGAELLQCLTC